MEVVLWPSLNSQKTSDNAAKKVGSKEGAEKRKKASDFLSIINDGRKDKKKQGDMTKRSDLKPVKKEE